MLIATLTLPDTVHVCVGGRGVDNVTRLLIARGCSLPPYTKNENPRGDYSVSRSRGVGS